MAATLGVVALVLAHAGPASAQQAGTDQLPSVRLDIPAFERGAARRPSVRAVVAVRDCTARPTVTVTATWRRRGGRASLTVSGTHRILRFFPRTGARRTDRVTFRRVRLRRGTARVTAAFSTNWLEAEEDGRRCELRLPSLIGVGPTAGSAATGTLQLRTPLALGTPVTPPPRRGTRTDHIWTCGGGGIPFDCGLTVTLGTSIDDVVARDTTCPDPQAPASCKPTEPPACPDEADEPDCAPTPGCPEVEEQSDCQNGGTDNPPDWAAAAGLLLAGAIGLGGYGIAARQRTKEGGDVSDSWDDLARKEYAEPEEAISARASDLTKIGAPVAAFITAVVAAFGGWVADAPKGPTVIAVAIVVAVAVGGLFYVFAADFRSRAAVSVARFNNLCKHATAEDKANSVVLAKAEAAQTAAKEAQTKAEEAQAEAKARTADANEQIAAKVELEKQVDKLREDLRRCTEPTTPTSSSSYLALGDLAATAGNRQVWIHSIESDARGILRYLIREEDGRLHWVRGDEEDIRVRTSAPTTEMPAKPEG